MIDPKELRIGNFVCFSNEGTVFIVNEIHKTGLGVHDEIEDTWIEYDQFSPITITPEWLERFGWHLSHHGYWEAFTDIVGMTWDEETGLDAHFADTDIATVLDHIKSVHQLQNLYHALTGQELTAKEKQDVR